MAVDDVDTYVYTFDMSTKTTTIQKWGNSLAVRIPKAVAEKANLREHEPVDFGVEGGHITIKAKGRSRTIPKYSLGELLKGVTPKNMTLDREWLDVKPIGKEVR